MGDITDHNLDAALLDQRVAGRFWRKTYAYVPVTAARGQLREWTVGVAVKDESGYYVVIPDDNTTFAWSRYDDAAAFADAMNKHIGLRLDEAIKIVASTMRGT